MTRRRGLAAVLALLLAPALAGAWGWQGHKLITELAVERLPAEVRAVFAPLMPQLLEQCIQPDKKVFTDRREQRKHYLNVECFDPEYRALWDREPPAGKAEPSGDGPSTPPLQKRFFSGHMPLHPLRVDELFAKIPRDLASFHALPEGLQKEIGTVVYQPGAYHAELVKALRSGDAARIAGVTGYLSHYVADLHVPLHTTIDHEGAFHGSARASKGVNKTVHSRFESAFVNFLGPSLRSMAARHLTEPKAGPAAAITPRAIREAREAYALYPEVLAYDTATMRLNRGRTIQWKRFYAHYEPRMAPIVARQIARSAQMLADLIVSAYKESRRSAASLR